MHGIILFAILKKKSGVKMQAISQVVEGHVLNQVISLPKALQETKVRITVVPIFEKKAQKTTRAMLRKSLRGSSTEALTGVLKDISSIDLNEIQAERRSLKYERTH
jgi:hypothetical protein